MTAYAQSRGGLGRRVVRRLGPRALLILILLGAGLLTVTSGITQAVPELDPVYIYSVVLVATLVGWLMGLLPMRTSLALPLSLVLGLEYLLVRIGRLGGEILSILRAVGLFIRDTALWYWTEVPPVWEPIRVGYLELWTDMLTLLMRTGDWVTNVIDGGAMYDAVGSAIAWGLIVWLYSWWASWSVRRHRRPLAGIVPGSLLLSFVLSYTGSNPYIFLPVVGLTLVLMAATDHHAREEAWSTRGVDYSNGLWSDVLTTAVGITVAVVIVSAIVPSISFERIAEWVEEITSDEVQQRTESVADSFGLEQKPEPRAARPLESARVTSLPQRHLIGSGPELSRQVVMLIETGEIPPLVEGMPPDDINVPRHYWRSITYNWYFSRGWATSNTEAVSYEPGAPAVEKDAEHLKLLRQSIKYIGGRIENVVHVDGQLVSVDEPFDVLWRPPEDAFAATTEARAYRADSLVTDVTVEQLREASTEYPEWIVARYLQLPETVPQRVLSLARDLTATEPTPYDRARAIELYLREFEYTLEVPVPNQQEDIADFFLFEIQRGYCDYYATSMVVLARAAGLPARMVIGYASGSYDLYNARYVVTEADAHAWPEIYFPGYGWIEFEPTGGRPPIDRPSEEDDAFGLGDRPTMEPLVPLRRSAAWEGLIVAQWLLMGLGGVLAVVGVTTGAETAVLLLDTPQGMAARLNRRLKRYARRLRISVDTGDTPHELANTLRDRILGIAAAHGFTGTELVEPATDEIDELTELYTSTWYAPPGAELDRRGAVWTWLRLRWRLLLAWVWRRSGLPDPGATSEGDASPQSDASPGSDAPSQSQTSAVKSKAPRGRRG